MEFLGSRKKPSKKVRKNDLVVLKTQKLYIITIESVWSCDECRDPLLLANNNIGKPIMQYYKG